MEDILEQIRTLKEKAVRYENQRERYLRIAEKLKKAIVLINEALAEIDPVSQVKTRTVSGVNITGIAKVLYGKLQAGTEITADLIERTYPHLDKSQRYYAIKLLKRMSNVDFRKNGNKTILFAKKDY